MTAPEESVGAVERRARIEALIGSYPNLSSDQLADVLSWLRHEATARDLGLLASNPSVASQYSKLRSDHLDGWSRREAIQAAVIMTLVAAAAGWIIYLAS